MKTKIALGVVAAVIVAALFIILSRPTSESGAVDKPHPTTTTVTVPDGGTPTKTTGHYGPSSPGTVTVQQKAYRFSLKAPAGDPTTETGDATVEETGTGTLGDGVPPDPGTVQASDCQGDACGWRPVINGSRYGTCRTICWQGMVYTCDKRSFVVTWANTFGDDLFKAEWTQKGCYNVQHSAVCCVMPLNTQGWTTGLGESFSWRWEGVLAKNAMGWYEGPDGLHYNNHYSWSKTSFKQCLPNGGAGCSPYDHAGAKGTWGIHADPHPCCGATPRHWLFFWSDL